MSDWTEEQLVENLKAIEEMGAYAHYRPLREAAAEFIHWAETPQLRVYTGIDVLDAAMRGTAPGEVTLLQGFTHSGKTLVATELMRNNAHTPMVLFTPDETRPLVLTKLAAAEYGVNARELEQRIQRDDATARDVLLGTADKFGKLAIFDESVSLVDMDRMFAEATHAFQQKPKAVIFDYAELLEGFDDVKAKLSALKSWGKRQGVGLFILHQASRTSGSSGRKMSIDSGNYGGEQQSTHVIGVRRKKYMHYALIAMLEEKIANASNPKSIEEYHSRIRQIKDIDLPKDENTITVSLNKNKRPPCDLVDDVDFEIEVGTGKLRRIVDAKDSNGNPIRTTKAALTYLRQQRAKVEWEETEMF